ncbi:hypothetical protein TNIN_486841 [Trichonephila inaurata madagascariensis]|uniref:Uncharacterized protein n=1 Tax=Trichonephila inaurata madagascariensis TaxID=2747483 RepID=A0A8X6YPK5_9ARAC|nr:hypothetical protein TNIN_486841 [Trichonephila inaurata madagascariensis]
MSLRIDTTRISANADDKTNMCSSPVLSYYCCQSKVLYLIQRRKSSSFSTSSVISSLTATFRREEKSTLFKSNDFSSSLIEHQMYKPRSKEI